MSSAPNTGPPNDGYTRMPKWVKWTLITLLVLAVLGIFAALVVGGDHGPGRHTSAPSLPPTVAPASP